MKTRFLIASAALMFVSAGPLRAAWQAGLQGGHVSGSFNITGYPAVTNVYTGPHCATNYTGSSQGPIWGVDRTWVYTGQMFLAKGTHYFGETVDDSTLLKLDGQAVINDGTWNNFKVGGPVIVDEAVGRWVDVELRFGNGSGGAGPASGNVFDANGTLCGFGHAITETMPTAMTQLVYPCDPGDRSVFRYDDGMGFMDVLEVSGAPVQIGTVSPGYGYTNDLAYGATIACSVSTTTLTIDGTQYAYDGYEVYDLDLSTGQRANLAASGTAAATSFTYTHGTTMRELVWKWRVTSCTIAVENATPGSGTLTGGGTYAPGAMVTLTATPAQGCFFVRWTGDLPDSVTDPTAANISFTVDRTRAITGAFAGDYYVANTAAAHDQSGYGLSPDLPFATLGYAVSVAGDHSRIHVAAGEYKPSAEIVVDKALTILGAGTNQTFFTGTALGGTTRMFTINHAEAILEDITIQNTYSTYNNSGGSFYGTALLLQAGTVLDCRFYKCSYNGYRNHAAICVNGGLLENCEIEGSSGGGYYGNQGVSLCLKGGTVTDCRILRCPSVSDSGGNVCVDGGTLRNSRIAYNGKSDVGGEGSGIRLKSGVVENCLVRGNTNRLGTAGVYVDGGTLRNSTVTGNVTVYTQSANSGVNQRNGTVVNNIIWGNATASMPFGSYVYSQGTFRNNLLDKEIAAGSDNFVANPFFTDATAGDFSLQAGSPALDAADATAAPADDITGTARPQGEAPDLGCSERVPSTELKAAFTVQPYDYPVGGTATFTATPEGADLSGLTYAWYVDGGMDPVGTGATYTWSDLPPGPHAVKLVVSMGATQDECARAQAIDVHPLVAYVSHDGSATYPYNTAAKATPSPNDALNAIWHAAGATGAVVIAAGEYDLKAMMVLDCGIRILGAGRDQTFLMGGSYNNRGFFVRDDNALVSDVTIQGIRFDIQNSAGSGGGMHMTAGRVRNCHIRNCTLVNAYQYGSLVYMTGGTLESCELDGGYLQWSHDARGNALSQQGGTVTNCFIHHNTTIGTVGGAGAYINNGLAVCNRYAFNGTTGGGAEGAGIRIAGGTVRNCLIEGNTNKANSAGACISAGRMEHCTIVGNVATDDATGKSGLYQTGGAVVNTIIYGNGPVGSTYGSCYVTGGAFQTNVVDKAVDSAVGGAVSDPLFVDAASGDYRLGLGSPAIDAGAPLEGMDGDYAGAVRPQGSGPDIGCYEYVPGQAGFIAAIVISSADYPVGATLAATCTVEGAPDETVEYAWFMDGGTTPVSTDETFSFAGAAPGLHDLRLIVTSGGLFVTNDVVGAYNVHPFVTYVSDSGSSEYPYDSWATATPSPNDAILALWSAEGATGGVFVAEGVYALNDKLSLARAWFLRGEGRGKTVLKGGAYEGAPGILMTHPEAVVENLTVSNMVYSVQLSSANGAGVSMTDGTLRNCHITRCRTVKAYQSGSGLYIAGGLAENCEIDHCMENWSYASYGNGVYQTGGIVSNCYIHHNPTHCQNGGAGVGLGGGLMTACRIEANGEGVSPSYGPYDGSGVNVYGGTLRNSLIVHNSNTTANAGVKISSGRVENCTIFGNVSTTTSSANSGLVQTGGTVVNSIVYGNGTQYAALGSSTVTGGSFATNLVDLAVGSGVGCIVAEPGFADGYAGDFHLRLGSAAIDAAASIEGVTYDLDGVERPQGTAPDVGCYEYVPTGGPLTCGILIPTTDFLVGDAVPTASAVVEGADLDGLVYSWYVDGAASSCASGAEFTWPGTPEAGLHDLRLVVGNAGGETATNSVIGAFNVHPLVAYVANDGSSTYPYDTVARATTNIVDAFNAVWSGSEVPGRAVRIATGAYPLTDTIALSQGISITGAGRDATVLTGTNLNKRAFMMTATNAVLEDLTLRGVRVPGMTGGAVRLDAGTVRRCRIAGTRGTSYTFSGLAIYVGSQGLLEDTLIEDNIFTGNPWTAYNGRGAGIYLAGGVVRRCAITGCICTGNQPLNGLAVSMTSGLFENNVVANNDSASYDVAAGLHASGGTVRGCLFQGNHGSFDGVAIRGAGAAIVNCTVVTNTGAFAVRMTGGALRNSIVWGNAGGDLTAADIVTVANTDWSECFPPRDGNFAEDPRFRNPASGDWRLRVDSPCINAGDDAAWDGIASSLDLAGQRRRRNQTVDMGCYEQQFGGTTLILR